MKKTVAEIISRVAIYHFFLTPKLIYDATPVSVLVAVLVTFGVFTKQNEVTALKACGVSLHRMSVPVLLASALLSAGCSPSILLRPRGQPPPGRHPRRNQGTAAADVFEPGAQVDSRTRLAPLLLQALRAGGQGHGGGLRLRTGSSDLPPAPAHFRRARALGAPPEDLGFPERLVARYQGTAC